MEGRREDEDAVLQIVYPRQVVIVLFHHTASKGDRSTNNPTLCLHASGAQNTLYSTP
jgi:hypothetical protein